MKSLKTLLFSITILFTSLSFAQEKEKWSTEGNIGKSDFFIGTTNHEDLIFKTNNLEGFRLDKGGHLQILNDLNFKSLENPNLSENRIMAINSMGKVIPLSIANLKLGFIDNPCYYTAVGGQQPLITDVWTSVIDNPGYGIIHTGAGQCVNTRVGIGTNNPLALLDVRGKGLFSTGIVVGPSSSHGIKVKVPNFPGHKAFTVVNSVSTKDVFRVMSDGHVWCTELDIKLVNDFPDYVFAKDYNLMPLEKLALYISKNKHLPNIPSAEEVAKDGLSVGEMQVKQMEKIEEITLYLIELKKELDTVKKENAALKQLVLQK